MSTEKTTAKKTSVFDAWLKNGKFSADAFRRENSLTRIRQAVEFAQDLAQFAPDVNLPKETTVDTDAKLLEYLALVASAFGSASKKFAGGKRVIVYFAVTYILDVPNEKERKELLNSMPKLFSYQLGDKASKAWTDILSNCNTWRHTARSVGKNEVPQAIFGKLSAAATKIASAYSDPLGKRPAINAFFDDYWRQYGTYHTDEKTPLTSPTQAQLTSLWESTHTKDVTDTYRLRRKNASKEKRQKRLADDILTGKANDDDIARLDETGQAFLAQRVKDAGYRIVARPELLKIESALTIDHKRKDAIAVLESAMDALGKIDILISTRLQFARDFSAKKTETPALPSVDCSKASFAKAFRFSGKEISDLKNVQTMTVSRQPNNAKKTDVVGHGENGEVLSTIVSSALMYRFRTTRKALKGKNEFSVVLVEK